MWLMHGFNQCSVSEEKIVGNLKDWFFGILSALGTAHMFDRVMIAFLGLMGVILLLLVPKVIFIMFVISAVTIILAIAVFPALGEWAKSQLESESVIDKGKKVS